MLSNKKINAAARAAFALFADDIARRPIVSDEPRVQNKLDSPDTKLQRSLKHMKLKELGLWRLRSDSALRVVFFLFTSLFFLSVPVGLRAQAPPRPMKKGDKTAAPSVPSTPADVARGKYIVENVAMCPQCHTPRESNGALDPRRPLDGAPEYFQPPYPDANWPLKAPRIGGNPSASDQDLIKLLMSGIWTDGKPLRLPMMPFRMNEADAKAVVAYLKSVRQEP